MSQRRGEERVKGVRTSAMTSLLLFPLVFAPPPPSFPPLPSNLLSFSLSSILLSAASLACLKLTPVLCDTPSPTLLPPPLKLK